MSDLQRKQRQDEDERIEYKGPGDWPGDNNQLPNNETDEDADLPSDIARDVKNEGVMVNPDDKPIS